MVLTNSLLSVMVPTSYLHSNVILNTKMRRCEASTGLVANR